MLHRWLCLVMANLELTLPLLTGCVAAIMVLFASVSYLLFAPEKVLQRSLAMQAVVLIAMYIGFYWNGFFVTLLWVAFSIVLFGWGIFKSSLMAKIRRYFINDRYFGKARHL